jgi:hypothetical protein
VKVIADVENSKAKEEFAVFCRKALLQRSLLENGQTRNIYARVVGDMPEIGKGREALPEYNSTEMPARQVSLCDDSDDDYENDTHAQTESNLQL